MKTCAHVTQKGSFKLQTNTNSLEQRQTVSCEDRALLKCLGRVAGLVLSCMAKQCGCLLQTAMNHSERLLKASARQDELLEAGVPAEFC